MEQDQLGSIGLSIAISLPFHATAPKKEEIEKVLRRAIVDFESLGLTVHSASMSADLPRRFAVVFTEMDLKKQKR